jgi:hypothetical protein
VQGAAPCPGMLINVNTLEAFKRLNKPQLLQQVGSSSCTTSSKGSARAAGQSDALIATWPQVKGVSMGQQQQLHRQQQTAVWAQRSHGGANYSWHGRMVVRPCT